jgi:hypothetical protein
LKKKEYKVYNLKSRKADASDRLYWSSKTPEERIAAMEVIRQQSYKIKNERPKRLRRVIHIIEQKKSK